MREKKEWIIPPNHRGLNFLVIKTFINEVFLKQQLLGYAFKTLRSRQLAAMASPLLNTLLMQEQKTRQLEVVRASKYLFALAPALESEVNVFNLRRFLHEDTLHSRDRLLLNGAAVNTAMLPNSDEAFRQRFQAQIDCIISIETTVSRALIEFAEELERTHETVLLPALFQPLDSNLTLSKAVEKHLKNYETLLTARILEPLYHALTKQAVNGDEFDYLQLRSRQLFSDIISVFKDFQSLPAVIGNAAAETLYGRLVAYAVFLDKRRDRVFAVQNDEELAASHRAAKQIRNEFHLLVEEHIDKYRELAGEADELAAQIVEKPSFFDKIMKKNEKVNEKLEAVHLKMRQEGYAVHDKIYHLPPEWRSQVVNLEFDAQLPSDGETRRYALPDGENGVTRLPLVLRLEELRTEFDLARFADQLA